MGRSDGQIRHQGLVRFGDVVISQHDQMAQGTRGTKRLWAGRTHREKLGAPSKSQTLHQKDKQAAQQHKQGQAAAERAHHGCIVPGLWKGNGKGEARPGALQHS